MKIKIIVPKKNKKWFISIGMSRYSKSLATSVYRFMEGKISGFLRLSGKEKLTIVVDYDQSHGLATKNPPEWFNDISSNNKDELLYALAVFLEDYLSKDYLKEKLKMYFRKEVISL